MRFVSIFSVLLIFFQLNPGLHGDTTTSSEETTANTEASTEAPQPDCDIIKRTELTEVDRQNIITITFKEPLNESSFQCNIFAASLLHLVEENINDTETASTEAISTTTDQNEGSPSSTDASSSEGSTATGEGTTPEKPTATSSSKEPTSKDTSSGESASTSEVSGSSEISPATTESSTPTSTENVTGTTGGTTPTSTTPQKDLNDAVDNQKKKQYISMCKALRKKRSAEQTLSSESFGNGTSVKFIEDHSGGPGTKDVMCIVYVNGQVQDGKTVAEWIDSDIKDKDGILQIPRAIVDNVKSSEKDSTDDKKKDNVRKGGMPSWAVVLIVLAVLVVIVVGAAFIFRRRRSQAADDHRALVTTYSVADDKCHI